MPIRLGQILRITDAPFVVATLFAAAAWCITHVVDRALERPLVSYELDSANSAAVAACDFGKPEPADVIALRLENLSSTTAIRSFEIFVALDQASAKQGGSIASPLCWINLGWNMSDGMDALLSGRSASQIRGVSVDELLPGGVGAVLVPLNKAELRLRVTGKSAAPPAEGEDRSTFTLIEAGLMTCLVKHETPVLVGLFVLFATVGFVSLTQAARQASPKRKTA